MMIDFNPGMYDGWMDDFADSVILGQGEGDYEGLSVAFLIQNMRQI